MFQICDIKRRFSSSIDSTNIRYWKTYILMFHRCCINLRIYILGSSRSSAKHTPGMNVSLSTKTPHSVYWFFKSEKYQKSHWSLFSGPVHATTNDPNFRKSDQSWIIVDHCSSQYAKYQHEHASHAGTR